jgi:hypothetical protein
MGGGGRGARAAGWRPYLGDPERYRLADEARAKERMARGERPPLEVEAEERRFGPVEIK